MATGVNGSTPEPPAAQAWLEKASGPPDSSNPAPAPPPAAPLSPAQARHPRPAGHCVGPAAPAWRRGRGGSARVASPAAARKRRPSPTRRRTWRAAAACARLGWGPRAGGAAGGGRRTAARGPAWQGYLLHGPLDGGVWRLGLLEQLQDLLKPLLVRFPLILHLGLLHIKPDTGKTSRC